MTLLQETVKMRISIWNPIKGCSTCALTIRLQEFLFKKGLKFNYRYGEIEFLLMDYIRVPRVYCFVRLFSNVCSQKIVEAKSQSARAVNVLTECWGPGRFAYRQPLCMLLLNNFIPPRINVILSAVGRRRQI